jgi:hypothetical protein
MPYLVHVCKQPYRIDAVEVLELKLIKRALKHLGNICNIFTIDIVWFYIAAFVS